MRATTLARCVAAACFSVLASSSAIAGNPLDDLIEPVDGKSACFARVYDAEHLRRHPKQKTVSMSVWLSYEPRGGTDPMTVLYVALGLVQRGDATPLYSSGGCDFDVNANRDSSGNKLLATYPKQAGHVCMQSAEPDVFWAVSAQEGGHFLMDRGKDRDTLMLYVDDSLIMVKRANRSKQIDVKFGPDDRVFMLKRVDIKACAGVADAVTTPEPGQRRRRPGLR